MAAQPTLFDPAADPAGFESLLLPHELQEEWCDLVVKASHTHKSAAVSACTGVGKTPLAALLARAAKRGAFAHLNPNSTSLLFIAHTLDLVTQAANSLARLLPELRVEVEQGETTSDPLADIVVACRKSLAQQRRLDRLGRDRFAIGIADEGHHYVLSNAEWWRIKNGFNCFWLGLSATFNRADGKGLEDSFETCLAHYPMAHGIEDGYLVRVHQRYEYMDGIDLDPTAILPGADFTDAEVAEQMEREHPMAAVATAAIKYGTMQTRWRANRQVMVFCSSVRHARKVAELINRWNRANSAIGIAGSLYAEQDKAERDFTDKRFRGGDIRYLCVMNVGLEGYDHDGVAVGVNARPTTAKAIVEQAAGRIVRPLNAIRPALSRAADADARKAIIAASDKPGAMFVDMTGHNLKLTLRTAGLADVLAGRRSVVPHTPFDDDWVIQLKKKSLLDESGMTDLAREIMMAEEKTREEKKQAIRAADERQMSMWADTRYRVRLKGFAVDPFDLFDDRLLPKMAGGSKRGPTKGQYRALVNQGFDADLGKKLTRTQAGGVLDVMARRRKAGLCTYKMAALLQKHGYDPNMTFEEAARTIDTLAKNRWQRTDVQDTNEYGETA